MDDGGINMHKECCWVNLKEKCHLWELGVGLFVILRQLWEEQDGNNWIDSSGSGWGNMTRTGENGN
jgi:hypothetical protein